MSNKKLYVGGLPYSMDNRGLEDLFAGLGTIESAKIIMDRDTGRSKGFAFVEMSSAGEAQKAIQKLHGTIVGERTITVNEAKPQPERTGGGRGGHGHDRGRGW